MTPKEAHNLTGVNVVRVREPLGNHPSRRVGSEPFQHSPQ